MITLLTYAERSRRLLILSKSASIQGSHIPRLVNVLSENDDAMKYEWAYKSLVKDKDSRQAVMHFNLPEHQHPNNKDFVCTMYGIFHIRDNKLNFAVYMRSNDAILGTPTDIAFFTVLQQQMLNHLRVNYPDLELGTYTHTMDSYHIYERHFDLVSDMIKEEFISVKFPTLNKDLITNIGAPTSKLSLLETYHGDGELVSNDPVYKWIQNNMKDEVIV